MSVYYAVKMGKKPGIYNSWDEVLEQIEGFQGASFKKCSTKEEALKVLGIKHENELNKVEMNQTLYLSKKLRNTSIYIDGSFDIEHKVFAYAFVVVEDGKIIYKESKAEVNKKTAKKLYSASGELKAAMKAVQYAANHNKKNLIIYHDYEGTEKLVNKKCKPKNDLLKKFVHFMENTIKNYNIKLTFVKVKAHQGNKFNDLADKMAKEKMREFREKEKLKKAIHKKIERYCEKIFLKHKEFFLKYETETELPKEIIQYFLELSRKDKYSFTPEQTELCIKHYYQKKIKKDNDVLRSFLFNGIFNHYKECFTLEINESVKRDIKTEFAKKCEEKNLLLTDQEINKFFQENFQTIKESVSKSIQKQEIKNKDNKDIKRKIRKIFNELINEEPILYFNFSPNTANFLVKKLYQKTIRNGVFLDEGTVAKYSICFISELILSAYKTENKTPKILRNIV